MAHAMRSYALMMKWELLGLKATLPFIVIIQLILAGGTVYGLGYLYPDIDPLSAKYIVTGATTMTLITLGISLIPQNVAQLKEKDIFDYLWSLPVPRPVYLMAEFTVWTAVVAPGVVLALVIGSARYDFGLHISPWVVPAFLLVPLTAVVVGMSIAHLSPSPVLTVLVSNVLIFSLFLFSPVNFPIERLPSFLQYIHTVLPVKYMADLVRGTVTTGLVDDLRAPFAIVSMWCVAGVASLWMVFTRRR